MGIRSRRRRTRTPETNLPAPPPSRRRRLNSGRDDYVHVQDDLPRSPERRDWAALPRDVLWVILSLVPQEAILGAAGLVCASWRRVALDEPLLWRRIDLPFRGRVNDDVLLFLANGAPSLRSLHVTSRFDMPVDKFVVLAKKLPMLQQFVLSYGQIEQATLEATLAALVDHCPRLQLLHVDGCRNLDPINTSLRERLECRIKDLRLPGPLPPLCGPWQPLPLIIGSFNLGLDLESDDEDERTIF